MTDNTPNNIEQSPGSTRASLTNGIILAVFAMVSTGLIAVTHLLTKERISASIESALARRLNEIVDKSRYDNDVYHDCTLVKDDKLLGSFGEQKVYRMRRDGKAVALVLTTTAPQGYGGKIDLLVGVNKDGSIAGVRVTRHQETPGLGDKIEIEKSDWIKIFNGKSLQNPEPELWKVSKDGGEFDALTGATITPRAIVDAVYKVLLFLSDEQRIQQLFSAKNNCGEKQS